MTEVTPGPGGVRVFLAPPAFLVVTADEVTLFDGGDAGRVLWRAPDDADLSRPVAGLEPAPS